MFYQGVSRMLAGDDAGRDRATRGRRPPPQRDVRRRRGVVSRRRPAAFGQVGCARRVRDALRGSGAMRPRRVPRPPARRRYERRRATMTRFGSAHLTAIVSRGAAAPAAQQNLAPLLETRDTLWTPHRCPGAAAVRARARGGRGTGREAETARALFGLAQRCAARRRAADGRACASRRSRIFERLGDQLRIARACLPAALTSDADLGAPGSGSSAPPTAARAAAISTSRRRRHDSATGCSALASYEQSMRALVRPPPLTTRRPAPVWTSARSTTASGRVYRAHGRLDEALKYQKAALDLHRSDRHLCAGAKPQRRGGRLPAPGRSQPRRGRTWKKRSRSALDAVGGRRPAAHRTSCAPTWRRLLGDLGQLDAGRGRARTGHRRRPRSVSVRPVYAVVGVYRGLRPRRTRWRRPSRPSRCGEDSRSLH